MEYVIVMQNVIYFCQEIWEKCVKIYCVNFKRLYIYIPAVDIDTLFKLQTYLTIYGF